MPVFCGTPARPGGGSSMVSKLEVAVVGAGPYGLAVGFRLNRRKVTHRVFGRPLEHWTDRMPSKMILKSEPVSSSMADPNGKLGLRYFCAETGADYEDYATPLSLETFVAYGKWFHEQAVPTVEQVDVKGVRRNGDGFVVE